VPDQDNAQRNRPLATNPHQLVICLMRITQKPGTVERVEPSHRQPRRVPDVM
jgi:hypothetical protein